LPFAFCLSPRPPDLDGKLIWEKDLGVRMRMRLGFGEGTAPVRNGDTLVLNFDQESVSFIVTLDKNTGKELWRSERDEASAWAMPLVVEHGGRKQVIVSATNKVRCYDLKTGKLIRRHPVDEHARQFLHALSGAARWQTVPADRYRHAQLPERAHGSAVLCADAAA
jgi:outer membrane protein assembly factor BamB